MLKDTSKPAVVLSTIIVAYQDYQEQIIVPVKSCIQIFLDLFISNVEVSAARIQTTAH